MDVAALLRGRMLVALEGVSGGRVMRGPFAALGLSVLATSLATSALAADLPVKAPPVPAVQAVSWTGLYVGGHAGYAWGRSDGDLTFDPGTGPIVVFDPSHRRIDSEGWLAGGQIGFNYQFNSLVFGLEADASWTNLRGRGSFNTIPGDVNWELSLKVGDGGNREGGISWGCLTPPLLHRRSDMPCPKITSSS